MGIYKVMTCKKEVNAMSHTPKPWSVAYDSTGLHVEYQDNGLGFPVDMTPANVQLMSAAPDLLEAAQTALANLHARSGTQQKWSGTDQLSYNMLENAISKAAQ